MLARLSPAQKNMPIDLISDPTNQSRSRKRSVEINPARHFDGWHYKIEKYHYPAFGVELREFIDKEKSRQRRKETGNKTVKIMRRAWSISHPNQFDFHEGDVFFSIKTTLQIVSIKDQIEIHLIDLTQNNLDRCRDAYLISETELQRVLKTGRINEKNRITPNQTNKEIHIYSINHPNPVRI